MIKGQFAYWVIRDGKVIDHQRKSNLVVDGARSIVAGLVAGGNSLYSGVRAIAIGTDDSTPTTDQDALGGEIFRRELPAFGTNTAMSANYIEISGGRVKATFRETLQPFIPNGAYGGTLKDGTSAPQTITEAGLFGNLIELDTPTNTCTVSASNTGGNLNTGTYTVKYTWVGAAGESIASSASSSGSVAANTSTGSLSVTVSSANINPSATGINFYISNDGATWYLTTPSGQAEPTKEITSYAANITATLVLAPTNTATAPTTNSSLLPGINDGGTMFNRILIGPTVLQTNDRIQVESILEF